MKKSVFFLTACLALSGNAFSKEIIVKAKKTEVASMDPVAPVWKSAQAERIPLLPQRSVSPNGGGSVKWIEVKSLYTSKEIYFLLSWEDKTQSATLNPSGKFTDACAVEFPYNAGALPSPFMGEKNNPVNIWMWRAVSKTPEAKRYPAAYSDFYRRGSIDTKLAFDTSSAQNLLAEGYGSLSLSNVQDIEATAKWKDDQWSVVIKRRLNSKQGAQFKEGMAFPIAFAAWDGDSYERNSSKSLSFWNTLSLDADLSKTEPKSQVEAGKRVFARHGCATCHGPEGKGGIKNPNAQGGAIPALTKVAEGFTKDEIKKVIRDGRVTELEDKNGPHPFLRMIAWQEVLDDQEINSIADYLFSLMPKGKKDEW